MKNNIIVQISEGLGNQFFMYAHAYALSKKLEKKLLIFILLCFQNLKGLILFQEYLKTMK